MASHLAPILGFPTEAGGVLTALYLVAMMFSPGGRVQLAVFAVWAILLGVAYLFAELVAHRPLRKPIRAT